MKEIQVYTDGGCSGNPGPGAWAYIIFMEQAKVCKAGSESPTTNNRMELMAVISALRELAARQAGQPAADKFKLQVYSDSIYLIKGITTWIKSWEKNGWKSSSKQPVKNQDLWQELRQLTAAFTIQWHWVKGHHVNEFNNECDSMVQKEIKRLAGSR